MSYIGYPYSTDTTFNLKFEGDFVKVPTGSTDDRTNNITAPEAGMFRFNTDESSFEGYTGNEWGSIGGGSTVDFLDADGTARVISLSALPFYLANSSFSPICMSNKTIPFVLADGTPTTYKVK